MVSRTIAKTLKKTASTFPSIVLTGPRQSGKTTLLKELFGKTHAYANMENPATRLRAKSDPVGFLNHLKTPVILDEIQYVPELLTYIKEAIDNDRRPGNWLITGSQNFSLMQGVSESLAGRTAVLSLLPLSVSEILGDGTSSLPTSLLLSQGPKANPSKVSLANIILRGGYPEIVTHPKTDRDQWYGSYFSTYLERDIRNLKQVGDLGQFEVFVRACASRTGQILDLAGLSREIGVSFPTTKRWLSLLETGYQVFLLYPYYKNIGKRLVKRPKLYFTDTGLVSYLLGINTPESLYSSSLLGPLFETLVVTDFWKRFYHHGQRPSMYYLRTQDGLEIDLVIELQSRLNLIEIKSSSTITPQHAIPLTKATRDLTGLVDKSLIISNSPESFFIKNQLFNFTWKEILAS